MPRGVAGLSQSAPLARDATVPPSIHAAAHDHEYLLALAAELRAELVSGNAHLLELRDSSRLTRHAESTERSGGLAPPMVTRTRPR
jgi:hypothetical protein